MKVQVLRSAMSDLAAGRRFYERQGAHLGDYFYSSLFADIDRLTTTAGIHPQVFGFHRLLAERFPYAVYYRTSDDVVLVYRILDCRQDPTSTEGSLRR